MQPVAKELRLTGKVGMIAASRTPYRGPEALRSWTISIEESWTIGRLLEWTHQYFAGKKLESPRLDAELLLAHALHCSRIQLYTMYDAEVAVSDRVRFRELVLQRAKSTPVAYLVGEREFYSLAFEVGPAVLIPRPETEHLVGAGLEYLKSLEEPKVLEVGVGSGAVVVTLLVRSPSAKAVGVELSTDALAVAKRNAEKHGVTDRLNLLDSDLLKSIPLEFGHFDLIVSNPPYIADHEWDSLPTDVRLHEPRLALAGGSDGLDVYKRLIPQSAERLKVGGRLLMEIGYLQEEAVLELIAAEPTLIARPCIRDFGGRPRVVAADRVEPNSS